MNGEGVWTSIYRWRWKGCHVSDPCAFLSRPLDQTAIKSSLIKGLDLLWCMGACTKAVELPRAHQEVGRPQGEVGWPHYGVWAHPLASRSCPHMSWSVFSHFLSCWMLHCGPMNPCDIIFHPWEKAQVWSKGGDDILTYGYVKPRVQWFPTEEDPPTDPSKIA